MNILFILFNPVGKGTYWRALYLARGLAEKGHKVTILATSHHRRLRFHTHPDNHPGVTIVESPDLLWGPLRFGWDIWNVIARISWSFTKQFDLVHAFESRPVVILPALYWQRFRGAKLVLDWCDWFGRGGSVEERPNWFIRTILRSFETFFEERFRTWADSTTVINSTLRHRAITLGVPSETIMHLPNGSNIDELHPLSQTEARNELGWPQDIFVIGYIGTIFYRDAHLMAQAFNIIRQTEPRTRMLLAGYCNVAIETLVKDANAIQRTGPIRYDEINIYLAACDICWLPLRDSGANRGRFPLKINDYMAVGKPVVATDVGDIAALVQQGEFGLIAHDQPEALAMQVHHLLHNPTQREIMGQRARHLAETQFNWTHISDRLSQFYEHVLDENETKINRNNIKV